MSLSHGFSIELLGLRLGFSAGSGTVTAPVLDAMERYVFPGLARGELSAAEVTFRLDEASALGLVSLQREVDNYVVGHAAGFTFVHAGVIGLNGAVALLVGSSGHGKSTLVAEMIGPAMGATYYSDEYAAIDEHGRVHPYPRALLVREGRPDQRPVLPRDLGARVADGPGELRVILNLPYTSGGETSLTGVGQSEGLRLLLENTPHVLEDSPALFQKFARAAGNARAFIGVRGDAAEAGRVILELLRER